MIGVHRVCGCVDGMVVLEIKVFYDKLLQKNIRILPLASHGC